MNTRFGGLLNEYYEEILKCFPHYNELRHIAVQHVKSYERSLTPGAPCNILEIGCGRGETTELILQQTKKTNITALDHDLNMITHLKNRLSKHINTRLKVIHKDVFDYLPSVDGSMFDVIIASWVFHNFQKDFRKNIFQQIYDECLKTHGMLVIVDKIFPNDFKLEKRLFEKQLIRLNALDAYDHPKLKKMLVKHETEDIQPQYIMKEYKTLKLLKDIGYRKVNITTRKEIDVVLICVK